jgi:hypothetical protein
MCRDHQAGQLPQPDLTNLERYLEVGIDHNGEQEMPLITGYHDIYKSTPALRHQARPLYADYRLWTADDVAQLEREQTTLIDGFNEAIHDQKAVRGIRRWSRGRRVAG